LEIAESIFARAGLMVSFKNSSIPAQSNASRSRIFFGCSADTINDPLCHVNAINRGMDFLAIIFRYSRDENRCQAIYEILNRRTFANDSDIMVTGYQVKIILIFRSFDY
jgi:hypothetical protein